MKAHSLRNHSVLVGGLAVKSQIDGDEGVQIETANDWYTGTVGADGIGTSEENYDHSATITITLLSSSDDNAKLSALLLADGPEGAGITTLDIKDNSGSSFYHATAARLMGPPKSIKISKTVNARAWVFWTDKLLPFVGGN